MKKIMALLLSKFLLLSLCIASSDGKTVETSPARDGPSVAGNGYLHYTTEAGTLLAPVIDFAAVTGIQKFTWEKLREQVKALKNMGFSRLYVVVDLPGYPMFSGGWAVRALGSAKLKSIQALDGDLNAAIAKVCREQNMEAIAIFKPYENGGMLSVPDDATVMEPGFRDKTATGTYLFFDKFVDEHPEMRVQRRNDYDADDHRLPITKIEMEFMLDQYADPNVRGTHMSSDIPDSAAPTPKINLWVSRNNGDYSLYQGDFSYSYKIGRRTICDSNGIVLGENKRCNVLTITGINIGEEYPYVAITLEDSRNMRLIPYSMIRWYGGDKELKLTAATYVTTLQRKETHYPGQWTLQDLPNYNNVNLTGITVNAGGTVTAKSNNSPLTWQDEAVARFYKTGFVFSWYGAGHNGNGWKSTALYGLARGKRQHMGGSLCEAYPEVRQYWLDAVRQLFDAGFAGVDVRFQNHSSMIMDYMNYGFNEPIVARYKELHGADPAAIPMTEDVYLKLMKIRGDYFMLFLEDAAKLARERNSLLLVHLKDALEHPACSSIWNQLCHWTMPKIALDWRRCVELADEITIKDYYYKNYNPAAAGQIKDYAASLGKKIWVHCYYAQGDAYDETFLRTIQKDKRVSGILLYDVWGKFMADTPKMLEKLKYQERRKK